MTDTLIPHILALDTAQEDCGAAILLADGSLFMHVEHVGRETKAVAKLLDGDGG